MTCEDDDESLLSTLQRAAASHACRGGSGVCTAGEPGNGLGVRAGGIRGWVGAGAGPGSGAEVGPGRAGESGPGGPEIGRDHGVGAGQGAGPQGVLGGM